MKTQLVLLYILELLRRASAFNIAARHPLVIPSPSSSHGLFGYSVALLADSTTPAQMLVGEPRGKWDHHQELHQPGALHRCLLALAGSGTHCTPAVLDQTGNEHANIGGHRIVHLKNDSMFASTVLTAPGGLALVCGPGWKNQMFSYKHYLMNGLCYKLDWTNRNSQPIPVAPLVDRDKQGITVNDPSDEKHFNKALFYYAFGEAGFSGFVTQDGKEVILGAPGVFNWRGTVVRYRIDENGALTHQMIPRPSRSDRFEDFGYFGYSVSAGRFLSGLGNRVQYAAGAPRAAGTGKVLLFDLPDEGSADNAPMSVLQELSGHQFGEYFGAALLAEDVTGDGLADLVVGAPLHCTAQHGDAGRVYVYVNLGEGRLQLQPDNQLSPQQTAARFGSALAALGDINKDGFMDVLVGSPYEDSGRGAVYVLLGSAGGLRARGMGAQRIAARDLHLSLRAFGASLTASADVDDNGYNDVGVGAPQSGHAVLLRTRPVGRLTATLTPSASELSFMTTSFIVSVCLRYNGYRVEPVTAASVTVWVEGSSERALLAEEFGHGQGQRQLSFAMGLHIGKLTCSNLTVLLRLSSGSGDLTAPIDISMRSTLEEQGSDDQKTFCKACPVLDPSEPRTLTLRIPYATGCSDDTTCKPDLSIQAHWQDSKLPVVLGASREVALLVALHNAGEPAYLCRLEVTLPQPLSVARLPAACHQSNSAARLECDVAGVLGYNQQHELLLPIGLSALSLNTLPASLEVLLNVTSAGQDTHSENNVARITLPVTAQVDLAIVGRASPELGLLPEPEDDSGRHVGFTHTYEVRSLGPTDLQGAQISLKVPAKALGGSQIVHVLTSWYVLIDDTRMVCASRETSDAGTMDPGADKPQGAGAGRQPQDDWEHVEEDAGLSCGAHPAVCVEVLCPLGGTLHRGVSVSLRGRIAPHAVVAVLGPSRAVVVRTQADVVVPGGLPPGSTFRVSPAQLSTVFLRSAVPASVQPWVVALAVVTGLLLLSLLSLCLWKVGFFGRKKVSAQPPAPLSPNQPAGDTLLSVENSDHAHQDYDQGYSEKVESEQ